MSDISLILAGLYGVGPAPIIFTPQNKIKDRKIEPVLISSSIKCYSNNNSPSLIGVFVDLYG